VATSLLHGPHPGYVLGYTMRRKRTNVRNESGPGTGYDRKDRKDRRMIEKKAVEEGNR